MVFEMAQMASLIVDTLICFPRPYTPCRTRAAKAPTTISRSSSDTVLELRKGSVWVMDVNATQCLQYFCLSALVLGVTPSVVASHADRQALANIFREEGGTRPKILTVVEENVS